MGKFWFAVVVGAVLGILDGLTAWFTPAVRSQAAGIVVGSTIKGAIAGGHCRMVREESELAAAGNFSGIDGGSAAGLGSSSDAARILLRDHAPRKSGGSHRRLRGAEAPRRTSNFIKEKYGTHHAL